MFSKNARLAIYVQGIFGKGNSKTAEGILRYSSNPIVAIIDNTAKDKKVSEIIGHEHAAPIVGSIAEALQYKPEVLILGGAWAGGKMPEDWHKDIISALENGLDVVNGLHDFLSDVPEYVSLAKEHHCQLIDVRRPPDNLPIGTAKAREVKAFTVLTVGSDSSIGKMTTSLEIMRLANQRQINAKFVATGQTGIMIEGDGIAIDRVIGDFMAGAAEQMVLADKEADLIMIEGQGSLLNPCFSGVTLALMHGSCPKAMILCHKPGRKIIDEFEIPSLASLIKTYEQAAALVSPSKVIGIALNTRHLEETEALKLCKQAEDETNLPAVDPVRFGAQKLLDAILSAKGK